MKNLYLELNSGNLSNKALSFREVNWTYAELHSHIEGIYSYLEELDLTANSRVGLAFSNPQALLVSYYACFKAGLIPVPIPFRDQERVDGAKEAAETVCILDDPDYLLAMVKEPTSFNLDPELVSEEAMVIFTSGTTSSKLKGVRLSHRGVSATCSFMNTKMEVDRSIIECVCASVDHAFGFGRCHSVLSVGGEVNLVEVDRSLSVLLDVLNDKNCNAFSAPPSILSSLLRIASDSVSELGTQLKWMQTGAMRFDANFRAKLIEALPTTRIFLHYGLSEAMRVTFFEANKHFDKLHTEGPASDCSELRIIDENNAYVDSGIEGNIVIGGTNLCLGYLDEALWNSNLHNGYFVTSDRGYLDDDGFLVFCGRSDDTINCNGVLVHPDEIESKIIPFFPKIPFSVVGIPDPMGIKDTLIAMFVEGEQAPSLAEVAKAMKGTDKHLIPQKIVMMGSLPRTRSGKVNRVALKAEVLNRKV